MIAAAAAGFDPGNLSLTIPCREERLYDREAILGRDVSSVFPSQSQDAARASAENAKAALGAMKFVSEQQVSSRRVLHPVNSRPELLPAMLNMTDCAAGRAESGEGR